MTHVFSFADGTIFASLGRGLMNGVKLPVQELGGQLEGRGLFLKGTFLEKMAICISSEYFVAKLHVACLFTNMAARTPQIPFFIT